MTAGQAVVWYTGQFYALAFMTVPLGVGFVDAYTVMLIAIALATPFFIFFGWLSDRIGRKPIILGGCLLAAIAYFPIFNAMHGFANPQPGPMRREPAIAVAQDPNILGLTAHGVPHDRARDDGLRPDRRVPRRVLPGRDPLHVALAAVPPRQRRVRRLAALHRHRDRRRRRLPAAPSRGLAA